MERAKMENQIFIGIDSERVEATGDVLSYILETQEGLTAIDNQIAAEEEAKLAAQESAISKLEALGLTPEEIAAIKG